MARQGSGDIQLVAIVAQFFVARVVARRLPRQRQPEANSLTLLLSTCDRRCARMLVRIPSAKLLSVLPSMLQFSTATAWPLSGCPPYRSQLSIACDAAPGRPIRECRPTETV